MCALALGILKLDKRRDCRYSATTDRGEAFFAFDENEVKAFEVSVVDEKMEVYAVMSAAETFVSQHLVLLEAILQSVVHALGTCT